MLIGIDGNEANTTNRVGSNVYAFEIIKQIYNLAPSFAYKDIKFKLYLKKSQILDFPLTTNTWNYRVFGPKKAWTQFALPLKLLSEKITFQAPDIYFSPGHYAPRIAFTKTAITIMDLAFLKYPDEFTPYDLKQLTTWTKYSAAKALHIFTISQASKNDIVNYYQINPDKITVTYPAANLETVKNEADNSFQNMARQWGIAKPYFIYVGTLQPRKNLERLFEAFSHICHLADFKNYQLILVGKKGWLWENIIKKVRDLNLLDKIIFTGFVSDFEKIELIKNSFAFILPSLYEGFGLPVLEAMNLKIPVIVSNCSSLPEVVGSSGIYIDSPENFLDIEKAMITAIKMSQNERMALIASAYKQAQQFSWENCGKITLKKLMELAENK